MVDDSTTVPDLDTLELAHGAHDRREDGVCLLEAVAWVAGEEHTDHPTCSSPVLANYGRRLNDTLDDEARQRLVPFVPRLIGTAGRPELDQRAGLMAADWLVRVYTPTWLRLAGLHNAAHVLESAAEITSWPALAAIMPRLRDAQEQATAAWDAAWYAAGAAARAAAREVAWAAAWDAIWEATWDAARAAVWAAAREAIEAAARDAARDAAWDAARDAAGEAVWAAAWDAIETTARAAARATAWAAAEDIAKAVLKPAVERLQGSAIELYERMVAIYEDRAGGQPRGAER